MIFKLKHGLYLLAFLFLFSCEKNEDNIVPNKNLSHFISLKAANSIAEAIDLENAMSNKRLKTSKSKDRKIKEVFPVSQNNEVSFYVINYKKNEGFVIISADTRQIPILAFSDTGNFSMDNINEGLQVWIDDNQNIITDIRKGDIEMPEHIRLLWEEFESLDCVIPYPDDSNDDPNPDGNTGWTGGGGNDDGETNLGVFISEQKGPLMTTKWDQRYGFNATIDRLFDGQLPPAGCVAIAMAQVMKYHEHPPTYDWSDMPNLYATTTTAYLISDIGVMVNMQYSLEGSGISDTDVAVPTALKDAFGYSSSTHYIDYESSAYLSVVEEIRNNRPVIFRGGRKEVNWLGIPRYVDGHAWVCHGYLRTGWKNIGTVLSFNMNWGWYGVNDGYYNFTDFTPGNYNFNYKTGCIIGIKP